MTQEEKKAVEALENACLMLSRAFLKKIKSEEWPISEGEVNIHNGLLLGFYGIKEIYTDLKTDAKPTDMSTWGAFNNFCMNHPEFGMKQISYLEWMEAEKRPTEKEMNHLWYCCDKVERTVSDARMSVIDVVRDAMKKK